MKLLSAKVNPKTLTVKPESCPLGKMWCFRGVTPCGLYRGTDADLETMLTNEALISCGVRCIA